MKTYTKGDDWNGGKPYKHVENRAGTSFNMSSCRQCPFAMKAFMEGSVPLLEKTIKFCTLLYWETEFCNQAINCQYMLGLPLVNVIGISIETGCL
jgi:hypothetical protein